MYRSTQKSIDHYKLRLEITGKVFSVELFLFYFLFLHYILIHFVMRIRVIVNIQGYSNVRSTMHIFISTTRIYWENYVTHRRPKSNI